MLQLNKVSQYVTGIFAFLFSSLAMAQYTAPAAFTGAVGDATDAVGVLAAALIGVAAAAVVIMIALKYVKRIRSAA
jgi:hypothetical protein